MKTFCSLLAILLITSCHMDKHNNKQEMVIDAETFELELTAFDALGKKHLIPQNNIDVFIAENFDALLHLEEDLELWFYVEDDQKSFAIQRIEKDQNGTIHKADPPGFWDSETVCKTCRDEDCVVATLSEAIGEGTFDVDIRVRVKTTLGMQTGLQICYDSYKD